MSWSYKQTDVLINFVEVDYSNTSTDGWFNVSDLGLVRSRPTITSSSFTGSSSNPPGRNGVDYGVFDKRGNAKLEFEVLIAYDWPHEQATLQGYTVWDRIELLQSYVSMAKAISYREPGLTPKFFFKVKRVTTTINDAYEDAATVKVTAEVAPFRYDFDGWIPTELQNGSVIRSTYPGQPLQPTLFFKGAGAFVVYNQVDDELGAIESTYDGSDMIILDSETMLATFGSNDANANSYLSGNYDILRLAGGYTTDALKIFYQDVTNVGIATKDGIVI